MTESHPILRESARALLIDSSDRLLLFHHIEPELDVKDFWMTPGGGLDEGESFKDAVRRELWEEIGLANAEIGPWAWSRQHVWRTETRYYDSRERFYVVWVDQHDLRPQELTEFERAVIVGHRWWSVSEIQSATTEAFIPVRLGELIGPIVAGKLPEEPLETGS